jgi:cytochrome c oxidase subunit 2
LGVKQDAIPGFIHEAWFKIEAPGIYRGQCAELCGVGHGFMPIVVQAVPPDDYDDWLKSQRPNPLAAVDNKTYTLDELKPQGEKVYASRCAMCHQANGLGIAGMFPPLVDGTPFTADAKITAPLAERGFWKDGKVIMGSKEQHLNIVMHGIAGTSMQAIGQQLTDLEVAAVISYERNHWGNKTGDVIQPSEVAAIRKGAPS